MATLAVAFFVMGICCKDHRPFRSLIGHLAITRLHRHAFRLLESKSSSAVLGRTLALALVGSGVPDVPTVAVARSAGSDPTIERWSAKEQLRLPVPTPSNEGSYQGALRFSWIEAPGYHRVMGGRRSAQPDDRGPDMQPVHRRPLTAICFVEDLVRGTQHLGNASPNGLQRLVMILDVVEVLSPDVLKAEARVVSEVTAVVHFR